jgi:hypothetical protein
VIHTKTRLFENSKKNKTEIFIIETRPGKSRESRVFSLELDMRMC